MGLLSLFGGLGGKTPRLRSRLAAPFARSFSWLKQAVMGVMPVAHRPGAVRQD